jgi:hypothetical protein
MNEYLFLRHSSANPAFYCCFGVQVQADFKLQPGNLLHWYAARAAQADSPVQAFGSTHALSDVYLAHATVDELIAAEHVPVSP